MKKSIIMGGTGFLGRWLIHELLQMDDMEVTAFSRNASEKLNAFAYPANRVHAINSSFDTETDYLQVIDGFDFVFHLVSTTVPGSKNVTLCDDVSQNVFPTIKLLDACSTVGIQKFIYFSSGGTVYGDKVGTLPISENSPTDPICSYGIQKLINEKTIQMYEARHGLDYLIVRLANPYGPYQNTDGRQGAVAAFTWKILHDQPITVFGDGENIRDYIDVRDAVHMVRCILEASGAAKIYNIGSGIGTSLNQIVSTLEATTGHRAQIIWETARTVDVRSSVLSINRYLETISKERPRCIEKGIVDLVNFYKKEGI
jgi:UDP-glucose 4-epimerase